MYVDNSSRIHKHSNVTAAPIRDDEPPGDIATTSRDNTARPNAHDNDECDIIDATNDANHSNNADIQRSLNNVVVDKAVVDVPAAAVQPGMMLRQSVTTSSLQLPPNPLPGVCVNDNRNEQGAVLSHVHTSRRANQST